KKKKKKNCAWTIKIGKYGEWVQQEYNSKKNLNTTTKGQKNNKVDEVVNGPNVPRTAIAAPILVRAPFFSWFIAKYSGSLTSASKENVLRLMNTRRSFCVTPGGFYEAAFFEKDKEIVYIKQIKGFIKYALQFGYHVIPAYTFGESHTYWNWKGTPALKKWLCDRQIPGTIAFGPYCFILPYSNSFCFFCFVSKKKKKNLGIAGLHTIHGKGKIFEKIENPTPEDVDKYHAWYIGELKALFDRNKWRFEKERSYYLNSLYRASRFLFIFKKNCGLLFGETYKYLSYPKFDFLCAKNHGNK
ncbi:hypothetical protein RFI_12856, partial [Reticulomyxa filosa]